MRHAAVQPTRRWQHASHSTCPDNVFRHAGRCRFLRIGPIVVGRPLFPRLVRTSGRPSRRTRRQPWWRTARTITSAAAGSAPAGRFARRYLQPYPRTAATAAIGTALALARPETASARSQWALSVHASHSRHLPSAADVAVIAVCAQVSDVSTTRRGASRYSSDCISTRRDTVRVNSLASVPSVYSSSGGTSADINSLTLWS